MSLCENETVKQLLVTLIKTKGYSCGTVCIGTDCPVPCTIDLATKFYIAQRIDRDKFYLLRYQRALELMPENTLLDMLL